LRKVDSFFPRPNVATVYEASDMENRVEHLPL
jgi:hypothetical protein